MSFKVIAQSHGAPDPDFPRAHGINLRLSLLQGTFYSKLQYEYHEAFLPNGEYVYLINRRPNVPTGTNEVRIQIERHAAMLFGDAQFPEIETSDEEVRTILKRLINECELQDRMRHAAFVGSTGSVAIHMRALTPDASPARLFFDVYETPYLTPTFDPYQPDVLTGMQEKRKVLGIALKKIGYPIKDEDRNSLFYFQRTWDQKAEIWYVPWLVSEEKKAEEEGKAFTPKIDEKRSPIPHKLGFCPWVWIKNIRAGREIDGVCSFDGAIEHAIQLDYEDSGIVAGIKYNMSPTMVFQGKTPTAAPQMAATGQPLPTGAKPKTEGTQVKVPEDTKVYFVEMDGNGFKEAREKAKELRSSIIEAMHGDRIDPKEVTANHQGAQSLIEINSPMLKHVEGLRSTYGAGLLKLIRMAMATMRTRPVKVAGQVVTEMPDVPDLSLRWGDFYTPTAQEKLTLAQAHKELISAGIESEENATKDVAVTFGIADAQEERARVEADRAAQDERAARLAEVAAKVSATQRLDA